MRLQHVSVAIAPDGAAAARAFYGDLLGRDKKPVPPKLDPRKLVWFSAAGDLELHLMRTGDEPPPHAHFCLAVDAGLAELTTGPWRAVAGSAAVFALAAVLAGAVAILLRSTAGWMSNLPRSAGSASGVLIGPARGPAAR